MYKIIYSFLIAGVILFFNPSASFAAMSSTNYYIYSDAVGVNGGDLSTSSLYSLQDTAGDTSAASLASPSFTLQGGYQAMERGTITISIDQNSLNLGTLSTSQVNSASTTVTVSTDSTSGYTLSTGSVSGTMPAAVADGVVTAGSE